jgi:hypothetical protein
MDVSPKFETRVCLNYGWNMNNVTDNVPRQMAKESHEQLLQEFEAKSSHRITP